MTHRRYQYGAAAGTVLLAAAATACVHRGMYAVAAMFGIGVAILLEAAARERRRHLRTRAEHEWARRAALGKNPAPLRPCCLLARTSRGKAHHHTCTRDPTSALLRAVKDELRGNSREDTTP
ncbi:hypothetical protein [Streptomyces sp. NPDC000888]